VHACTGTLHSCWCSGRMQGHARLAARLIAARHVQRTEKGLATCSVAAGAKRAAGGVGGGPQVGQPGDVDGPPGSGGPAGAQDTGPPHESVEPPFTTRMPSGSR